MSPHTISDKAAQRLCIYICESDRWRGKSLYTALLETLQAQDMAGVTVTRGIVGFGSHSRVHTDRLVDLSSDLPLCIEVIDLTEKINKSLEVIAPMVGDGLITLESVHIVKYSQHYLNPLPTGKPVSEIMTRDVITMQDQMTVAEAWELMLKHLIKGMPVLNAQQQVVGMLTDDDLLSRAGVQQRLSVAARLDDNTKQTELFNLRASPLKVGDVMSSPVITVRDETALGEAATSMVKNGIIRLPVLDENGKLVGVISRLDVLKQVLDEDIQKRVEQAPVGDITTLQQIMLAEIPTIHKDASLSVVIERFLEAETRRLIVVNDAYCPLGLISDSDAVARVQPESRHSVLQALLGKRPLSQEKTRAIELMSPGVLTAEPETPLIEAAQKMLIDHRKWLVVVDKQGKAIGLVDRQVLLRALAQI